MVENSSTLCKSWVSFLIVGCVNGQALQRWNRFIEHDALIGVRTKSFAVDTALFSFLRKMVWKSNSMNINQTCGFMLEAQYSLVHVMNKCSC